MSRTAIRPTFATRFGGLQRSAGALPTSRARWLTKSGPAKASELLDWMGRNQAGLPRKPRTRLRGGGRRAGSRTPPPAAAGKIRVDRGRGAGACRVQAWMDSGHGAVGSTSWHAAAMSPAPALDRVVREEAAIADDRPRCWTAVGMPSRKPRKTCSTPVTFDFLYEPEVQHAFAIGFRVSRTRASIRTVTIVCGFGSPARDFIASQWRRSAGQHGSGSAHSGAVWPVGSDSISWSGSMFEYLMPSLVMSCPDRKNPRTDQRAYCP